MRRSNLQIYEVCSCKCRLLWHTCPGGMMNGVGYNGDGQGHGMTLAPHASAGVGGWGVQQANP